MIYPIPPGLPCGAAALALLTGEDPYATIIPALNLHGGELQLLQPRPGATVAALKGVLTDLGYNSRCYRHGTGLRNTIVTWAEKSHRWPGRALLLTTGTHALVCQDGRVYDNHAPHGPPGAEHPYARRLVRTVHLVEKSDASQAM
jgi:hypothetical protein